MTRWPAATASATSAAPGSERSGVPASETSATERALGERIEKAAVRAWRAVLVIGGDLRRDAVAVEKPPRHARVLAGEEVGGGERVERAERHVGKIADRCRHDVEPGWKRSGAAKNVPRMW